jgi:hypothetical protein
MFNDKLTQLMSTEHKEVDKYQVEVATSAIESIVVTSSINDKVDLSVNDKSGKIIIKAKSFLED